MFSNIQLKSREVSSISSSLSLDNSSIKHGYHRLFFDAIWLYNLCLEAVSEIVPEICCSKLTAKTFPPSE